MPTAIINNFFLKVMRQKKEDSKNQRKASVMVVEEVRGWFLLNQVGDVRG